MRGSIIHLHNKVFPENSFSRTQMIKPKLIFPQYIIFSDLDETLFDHNDPSHYWYHQLEDYLAFLRTSKKIYFVILTGCNLYEANKKMQGLNMLIKPDYLGVGFGTDIYYRNPNNEFIEDLTWKASLHHSYNKKVISKIINELKKQNINLVSEERSENKFKDSYYYFGTISQQAQLRIIRQISAQFNIKPIISKCNENIGDPADAYDVDFIPLNTGKAKAAKHIINATNVSRENIFAFGDSENDLELLKNVTNAYAVSNATKELKQHKIKVCRYNHARGILDSLQNYFEKQKKNKLEKK